MPQEHEVHQAQIHQTMESHHSSQLIHSGGIQEYIQMAQVRLLIRMDTPAHLQTLCHMELTLLIPIIPTYTEDYPYQPVE